MSSGEENWSTWRGPDEGLEEDPTTFSPTTAPHKLPVKRHNKRPPELKHLTCFHVEAPSPSPPPFTDATSEKRCCLPLPPLQSPLKQKYTPHPWRCFSVSAATLRGTSCQPSTCSTAAIARPAAPAVTLHPSLPPVRGTRDGAGSLVMKTFRRPLEQPVPQLISTHVTEAQTVSRLSAFARMFRSCLLIKSNPAGPVLSYILEVKVLQ